MAFAQDLGKSQTPILTTRIKHKKRLENSVSLNEGINASNSDN